MPQHADTDVRLARCPASWRLRPLPFTRASLDEDKWRCDDRSAEGYTLDQRAVHAWRGAGHWAAARFPGPVISIGPVPFSTRMKGRQSVASNKVHCTEDLHLPTFLERK